MTDSAAPLSVLARAGYEVFDNVQYERLREMASDWVHAQEQYRQCSECTNFADAEMEMAEHPETGRLICWECIKRMAEERADDEGVEHLFKQIRRAAE